MGFMVDKVAREQVSLSTLVVFVCVSFHPRPIRTHSPIAATQILANTTVAKQNTLQLMQLVLRHRILCRFPQGSISPQSSVLTHEQANCSRHTNAIANLQIKVSACDTVESGKYLQTFRVNLPTAQNRKMAEAVTTSDRYC